jgi:hypothetical protein
VKHWDAITTIYSTKDHANGEGARTGVESAQVPTAQVDDDSPAVPQKKQ